MAALIRTSLSRISLLNGSALKVTAITARNCGWIRDWQPGQYPKTEEERRAAAKKYNLIPEDYQPYPEGSGFGDYPHLPPVAQEARDPYELYDKQYRRENYGETFHVDYDVFTHDRHNPNEELRISPLQMVVTTIGIFTFFWFLMYVDDYYDLRNSWPMKPKQFPYQGEVHYTFEPVD